MNGRKIKYVWIAFFYYCNERIIIGIFTNKRLARKYCLEHKYDMNEIAFINFEVIQ
jgi:hypothetical protein